MTSTTGCRATSASPCGGAVLPLLLLLQVLSALSIIIAAAPEVKASDNKLTPPSAAGGSASATDHQSTDAEAAYDHVTNDVTADESEAANIDDRKRAMSALRLGRRSGSSQLLLPEVRNIRAMSALRLGRRAGGVDADDEGEQLEKRKSMSMLRLGRRRADSGSEEHQLDELKDDEEKRAMSALRLGRKRSGADETQSTADDENEDDVVDASDDSDDVISDDGLDKRAMGMLRLGRNSGRIERRKSMSMLRLG